MYMGSFGNVSYLSIIPLSICFAHVYTDYTIYIYIYMKDIHGLICLRISLVHHLLVYPLLHIREWKVTNDTESFFLQANVWYSKHVVSKTYGIW